MNIKKYCAPSVEAAMARVRREMGRDAVILSTRDVDLPNGETVFEVVAARERAASPESSLRHPASRDDSDHRFGNVTAPRVDAGAAAWHRGVGGEHAAVRRDSAAGLRSLASGGVEARERQGCRSEPEPSEPLQGRSGERAASGRARISREELPAASGRARSGRENLPAAAAAVHDHLLDQEVDPRLARELARCAATGGDPWQRLAGVLERLMPVAPADRLPPLSALIGPTGVGKTTTLAKLAANAAEAGQPVALLTCDTWRVAAVEQLAVFADLIEAPISVAYTPEELSRAAREFAAAGRTVLVDTPGRGPRDAAGLATLRGFLDALPGCANRLVVPATLRAGDVPLLLEAWLPLGVDGLILSKLDETTTFGPLLTLLARAQRPLCHVTFGQDVPDDVAAAADVNLARLILDGVCDVRSGRKTA